MTGSRGIISPAPTALPQTLWVLKIFMKETHYLEGLGHFNQTATYIYL